MSKQFQRDESNNWMWGKKDLPYKHGSSKITPPAGSPYKKKKKTDAEKRRQAAAMRLGELNSENTQLRRTIDQLRHGDSTSKMRADKYLAELQELKSVYEQTAVYNGELREENKKLAVENKVLREGLPEARGGRRLRLRR